MRKAAAMAAFFYLFIFMCGGEYVYAFVVKEPCNRSHGFPKGVVGAVAPFVFLGATLPSVALFAKLRSLGHYS